VEMLETILKDMAGSPVLGFEIPRIDHLKTMHEFGDAAIGSNAPHEEMNMVGHEAVMKD